MVEHSLRRFVPRGIDDSVSVRSYPKRTLMEQIEENVPKLPPTRRPFTFKASASVDEEISQAESDEAMGYDAVLLGRLIPLIIPKKFGNTEWIRPQGKAPGVMRVTNSQGIPLRLFHRASGGRSFNLLPAKQKGTQRNYNAAVYKQYLSGCHGFLLSDGSAYPEVKTRVVLLSMLRAANWPSHWPLLYQELN